MTEKYIIKYLKDKQLHGYWDGGCDNGEIRIFITDKNGNDIVDDKADEITDFIEEICQNALGYYSFAGEFTTAGEINYDHEDHKLIFDGSDQELNLDFDETYSIEVEVPKEAAPYIYNILYELETFNGLTFLRVDIGNNIYTKEIEEFEDYIEKILNGQVDYYNDLEQIAGSYTIPVNENTRTIKLSLDRWISSESEDIHKEYKLGEKK